MSSSSRKENLLVTPSYQFDMNNFNKLYEDNIEKHRHLKHARIKQLNEIMKSESPLSNYRTPYQWIADIIHEILAIDSFPSILTLFFGGTRLLYISLFMIFAPAILYTVFAILFSLFTHV